MYETSQETSWIELCKLLRMVQTLSYLMADVPSRVLGALCWPAAIAGMESVITEPRIKDMIGDLENWVIPHSSPVTN